MVAGVERTVHVYPLLGWYNLQQIDMLRASESQLGYVACTIPEPRALIIRAILMDIECWSLQCVDLFRGRAMPEKSDGITESRGFDGRSTRYWIPKG